MALEKGVQLTGKAKTDGITVPLAKLAEQTRRTREETEKLGSAGARSLGKLQQQAEAAARKQAAAAQRAETEIRRQIDLRSKFMEQQAKAAEKAARDEAIAAQKRGQAYKQSADDQIAFAGRFAAGVGVAAFAIDKLSQRQLQNTNVTRNLKISIDEAREATHGFVTDMDLSRSAALATSFGVAKTAEDFATLASVSQKLAARLGTDTATAMADLTTAISRQSPMILDNLGITLKLSEAHEMYAGHLRKSVKDLTDVEKREAFRYAALKKAEEATRGVNVATEGQAASIQRFKVTLANATDTVLRWGFAVADNKGVQSFMSAMSGALGPIKDFVTALGDAHDEVKDFLPTTIDLNKSLIEVKTATGSLVSPTTTLTKGVHALADAYRDLVGNDIAEKLQKTLDLVDGRVEGMRAAARFEFQNAENTKAALHDLMLEEKLHRSIGATEADLYNIQTRKYAVLKEEAALRFDMFEVMRLIREEEAALLDFGGTKKGGGGRRGPSRADLIRGQLGREAGFRAVNRDAFTARQARGAELGLARNAAAMRAAGEAFGSGPGSRQDELAQLEATEAARAEVQLNARMRAIEEQRAAGVEPLQLIAAEEQARVAFLEGEMARTDDAIEKMRIRDQIEAEHHAARLKRMAVEQQKQKAHQALVLGYTTALQEAMIGTGAAALQAALMGEGGVRAAVHSFAKGKSIEMVILAASETARGIAALASPFTAALAPGHFAAAGQAAAAGALIGVVAGVTAGGGGGGPGGTRSFGFGGGERSVDNGRREGFGSSFTGANFGRGQSQTRGSPFSGTPMPLSNPRGSSPTYNITINSQSLAGPDHDALVMDVKRAIEDSSFQGKS